MMTLEKANCKWFTPFAPRPVWQKKGTLRHFLTRGPSPPSWVWGETPGKPPAGLPAQEALMGLFP